MSFWIKLLSFLIWLPFLLLGLILLPFGLLYSFVLCVIGTHVLVKKGRTVLIVTNSAGDPSEFLTQLQELNLPKERSLVLDYANHKNWPWWSLPTRLFRTFGPIGMRARLTPDYLPAVLVLRKFRWPKNFSFGRMSKDPNLQFEELVSELKRD